MKTMEAVIEEEIQRSGVNPCELKELNLDGRCRTKQLEVGSTPAQEWLS